MTPYEQGFAAGERAAWDDRLDVVKREPPKEPQSAWWRGFWEAYQPRNPGWAMCSHPQRKAA